MRQYLWRLFEKVGKAGHAPIFFVSIFLCLLAAPISAEPQQSFDQRTVTVHLQEVFDAEISLIRFHGAKADYANPVGRAQGIKKGETAVISVPVSDLPGEFVLRIDYRMTETDHPYPAERIVFLNTQNIELTVNPPYINNDEKTKFQAGEKENTVYSGFMKENAEQRMPIDLLRQFLLSYDRPQSDEYVAAVNAFEQRRREYNTWLKEQTKEHAGLFVSRLFQFQYIPAVEWGGSEEERVDSLLKNYFMGIDFSDPWVVRSREMARLMDIYMRLYSMRAVSEQDRNVLLVDAGRAACAAVLNGHPDVYQWMVDYLYQGYEMLGIKEGIDMLNK